MEHFGLCVIITRPVLSYREVAEICVNKGIKYLQLREKHLNDRQLLEAALVIREVTKGTATQFVINDRADLAIIAKADMLHLGQDDMPIEMAREIVGNMPIGLSTHSIAQAQQALSHNPAYIGFGPVYPTTTKIIADPTVGTDNLRTVLGIAKVPVIAIGGIFPENIDSVLETGAQSFSLVRHLMETTETAKRIKEIQRML